MQCLSLISKSVAHSLPQGVRQLWVAANAKQWKQHAPPPPGGLRLDADVNYGQRLEDQALLKDIPALKGLQKVSSEALKQRNGSAFVNTALQTVCELKKLPSTHPLHLPSHLMFFNTSSPIFPMFDDVARKAFSKVYDVHHPHSSPNNCSGFYIAGPRGVGKTYSLRVCAIVFPLLLPKLLTVYAGYQSLAEQNILMTPLDLIIMAVYLAGVPIECPISKPFPNGDMRPHMHNLAEAAVDCSHPSRQSAPAQLEQYLDAIDRVNPMLGLVNQQGYSVMFVADEVGAVYNHTPVWSGLHAIATSTKSSLFVADSTSRLRTMIEGTDTEYLRSTYKKDPQPSLNSTKLARLDLPPFTKRHEYEAYLRIWGDTQQKQHHLQPQYISTLHLITSGRLRNIRQFFLDNTRIVFNGMDFYPAVGTLEFAIFETMCKRQKEALGAASLDPFHTVELSQAEILQPAREWVQRNKLTCSVNESRILHRIQELNIARSTREGKFTFDIPYHYLHWSQTYPSIFICHAFDVISQRRINV